MPSNIDQLIALLDGAGRDHDAGNPMPRERLTEALALAEAADDEHRAQVRRAKVNAEDCMAQAESDAEHRGWLRGYEHNGVERRQMCDERNDARADAERVRRGARCLRERCRRLHARARMAEEAASEAMSRGCVELGIVDPVEFMLEVTNGKHS